MNCTFMAAEAGDHTLEVIGEMLGITREGVRLIQIRALDKLRSGLKEMENHEPPLHQQSHTTGRRINEARNEVDQLEHESYRVSAVDC